jgi:hypothetical protein
MFTGNSFQFKMTQLKKTTAGIIASVWLVTAVPILADELSVSRFNTEGLAGWEQKSFKGLTQYHLTPQKGRVVVKATSRAAASGLVRKISFDPKKYRYLRWSWKIDHTIIKGDEKTRAGDDYAARLYVVFAGNYFWKTKAINYIWANHLKRGSSIPNAYTSSAIMVAVESGNTMAGQWHFEERDIFADYKKLFGTDPGEVTAIAIMTDTDDTDGEATAWYGDITLSSVR